MTRRLLVLVLLTAIAALASQLSSPLVVTGQVPSVTFNRDVLPILQKNCQVCHRPGEVAPMSFLTYESTRPWAKAIKDAVLSRKMPPWQAESEYGTFRNAPQLTQGDIKTLTAWVESGATEGDSKDKPPMAAWSDGWRIQPDVIVSMPQPYAIAAKGAGEVKTFTIPSPFKEDTWVSAIEIRPGAPSVVHHVIVQVPEQTVGGRFPWGGISCLVCSPSFRQAVTTPPFMAGNSPVPAPKPQASTSGGYYGGDSPPQLTNTFATMEAVYVPGAPPMDFRFQDSAKLVPGGKDIRIEVHYTPNGKPVSDQTRVGFTLAKGATKRRFVTMAPTTLVDPKTFRIPAGESNYESRGELTFTQNAELVWFMPHMHLRGKDMTFRLIYPNGRTETVLSAKFDFDWQLGYELEAPLKVTKGTRMVVTAHYDNSANNRHNPNPAESVAWGDLTSQEMLVPWFGVVIDHDADPGQIATYGPAKKASSAAAVTSPVPAFQPVLPKLGKLPVPIQLPTKE